MRFYDDVVDFVDIAGSCQCDISSVYSCFNLLSRYRSVESATSSGGAVMIFVAVCRMSCYSVGDWL